MKALKWIGIGLGSLVVLLLLAAGGIYLAGGAAFNETYELPTAEIAVPADSASLAWGEHLVTTHACQACHGEDLGGDVMIDGMPFAVVSASNLTSGAGGIGSTYTPADWERAVRHGVRPSGTGLMVQMPVDIYTNLADDDLAAMIAYLQTVPPVDRTLPATALGPIGRMVALSGQLMAPAVAVEGTTRPAPPAYGPTAEYGAYRTSTVCTACHAADLHGGPHPEPDAPYSPDLAAAGAWSLADFMTAMRTGRTPNGVELDPKYMPWPYFGQMTDVELEAIHRHLASMPPRSEAMAAH